MLKITIPGTEQWNEQNQEFITTQEQTLSLEHSLVSLSKWESKWCKPFVTTKDKTIEENLDYIKCMTLTQNVNPNVYSSIPNDVMTTIIDYINAPMTATTINERKGKANSEAITSELIYYWMSAFNIPFECQKWHLNRLLTLIRVCNIKSQKPEKMSKRDVMSRNAALNAARKKKLNTKG